MTYEQFKKLPEKDQKVIVEKILALGDAINAHTKIPPIYKPATGVAIWTTPEYLKNKNTGSPQYRTHSII